MYIVSKKILKLLINIKLIYKPLKIKKILILDKSGSDLIMKSIGRKTDYLDVRYSEINLYIIFKLFLSFKKINMQNYIKKYIEIVNPKIVISHIDNNDFFFTLKKCYPKINFLFIQNGTGLADFTNKELKKKKWHADMLFVYSDQYKKIYSKFVKGKVITIGSFKNNLYKYQKKIKKLNQLVFISPYKESDNKYIYTYNNKGFSKKDFYESEIKLLPILFEFCVINKIPFIVAGFYTKKNKNEEKFYKNILKNYIQKYPKLYFFKHRDGQYSSYKLIDKSRIVTYVDSALGPQSYSRGNKTIGFCFKSKINPNLRFGWPAKFHKSGKFWLNDFNKIEILQKLKEVYEMSSFDWNNLINNNIDKIIKKDFGNKIFKKHFKEFINLNN